ncbi:MAG: TonB-dependent receptor [Pedobacter sp.]|nr:MAG: TonB-dependent receptor [Pedobacter sp.]
MKNTLKIPILSLITVIFLGFRADDTPLEKLLKQIAKITSTYPQEKIHLHLDKTYYAVGEDIWLKAYLITAEKNEPSLLSKVLYVDLIDEKNQIKQNLRLSVTNGNASGNISIADSLASGNYRVRAYTNYMRNYADHFFFEKQIKIGNVMQTSSNEPLEKDKKQDIDLQFFPEGGNLIKGIRSKVGVKAVLANGIGANLSGFIFNENKEKVAVFTTTHAGMGVFALLPSSTAKHTAIVRLEDGTEKTFNLPPIIESGHALAINNVGENFVVRIASSTDLIAAKEVLVVAQTNGVIYASFSAKTDQPIISANIPKKNFPTGIAQFTLFTAEGKPLAERLVFVNHDDALKIEIAVNGNPSTKKKSELNLAVTDLTANPIDGNFSVSVVDVSKVPVIEDEETTILSNLLLTSELKGYIEKPNYYFNKSIVDREQNLDNLLLTQGWRRFTWTDILASKEPDITFRPELTYEISGKITGQYNKPLPKASVSLISTTPGLFLKIDTLSDSKGNFVFDRLDIPDSSSFLIQSKLKENKDVKIYITPPPNVKPYNGLGSSVNINNYLQTTKQQFQELAKNNMLKGNGILLNAVEIKTKLVPKSPLNTPNSKNASGSADHVITEIMLKDAINIFSPFYKSPGVMIKNGMIYRTRASKSFTNNPPMLLIVDGVQINQILMPDFIQSINPTDLEGIEILTSDYNTSVLGPEASGGVVYITTKSGPSKSAASTNIARIKNAGFVTAKQFYVPNYDDPKINQQMLDLRSTIYWNPNVITDEKGQAAFNFFNASTPGDYRVTVEGMDAFGNIGRKVYTYQVK